MKKMVELQTSTAAEQTVSTDGPGIRPAFSDTKRFTVEFDKNNKEIKLFADADELATFTHADPYHLEKLFYNLLTTVKQKLTFWRNN